MQLIPESGKILGMIRCVHPGDRVGFRRVLFSSVVFRIGYISDACYDESHSGRFG